MSVYYDRTLLIKLLNPIIAVGNTNVTNRNIATAGGFRLDEDTFDSLCNQGQSTGLLKISKYYKLPLQNKEGEIDIMKWSELTRGFIINYVQLYILYTIGSYALVSTGELKTKNIVDSYKENLKEVEDVILALDQNQGVVYPRLEELKLNDFYIPREDNPTISIGSTNLTKYERFLSSNDLLFEGLTRRGNWRN